MIDINGTLVLREAYYCDGTYQKIFIHMKETVGTGGFLNSRFSTFQIYMFSLFNDCM
jgi:hypothetical protein